MGARRSSAGSIDAELIAHDFKALPRLTMEPAEDTMLLAYLIEPGRAAYELDDLAQEYGVEPIPTPATTTRRLRSCATQRFRVGSHRRCSSVSANAAQKTSIATSSCR